MILDHNPDRLYIMESKVCDNVAAPILQRLGYYPYAFIPPLGTKRGLVLSWRAGFSLASLLFVKIVMLSMFYSIPLIFVIPSFTPSCMAPLCSS